MPATSLLVPSLLAALAVVPDHRRAAGRRHALAAVLAFVCCGMLCGGRSLLAIAEWGRAHQVWCCAVFGFRRCTPSVSTLHRILADLDVGAFEAALVAWIEPQLEPPVALEPVAIDGKAVRGAVLAQLAIGQRENELTQALPLLRQIDLTDVLITGDAMFAQRSLCAHIVEQGGQYLFEVKDNQPMLLLALQHSFRHGPGHARRADDGWRAWTDRHSDAACPSWPGG